MSSTGTSIALIEKNLPMDRISPLVEAIDMDKKRFLSTVLLACERNPRLMDFPVQQHVAWASSAAALGLEPDGVSGQAFPIPFGGNNPKIQLVIGYKGFNTMAGRAGITINSGIILEGDEWQRDLQAGHPFTIRGSFGDRASRNLIGVWAQAQMPNGSYSHPLLLDMSEILAVKAKAPGARKKDSPWSDAKVGMPAMAQKTAVRRLQRNLPALITPGRTWSTHNVGMQADTLHEEVGHATRVDLDGHLHDDGVIDGSATEVEDGPEDVRPEIEKPDGSMMSLGTFAAYQTVINKLQKSTDAALIEIERRNRQRFTDWRCSGNRDAETAAVAICETIDSRLNG